MQIGNYALQVVVSGQQSREYGHDGRTYVIGRQGADYTLRLSNRSGRRAKAVLAVDGLSVIDGKAAGKDGPGYVLEPYSTLDVPGWRLSDEQVARFLFGGPEESYAAQSGKAENVGVIACAFFEEERLQAAVEAISKCGASGPALTRSAGAPGSAVLRAGGGSLGTGFGRKTDHSVRRVEFTSRPAPSAVIEIRYEDAVLLRGLGLDVDDSSADLHAPQSFPADGYCAPPRNWRG